MLDQTITLDYGSGGQKTAELIDEIFRPAFADAALDALGDGALLPAPEAGRQLAFSTDSFVVSPLFFPGGDIGELAVCGTVNDLSMCGAKPLYLSLGVVIEEGFSTEELRKIVSSVAKTAKRVGVRIVTGDTKVVERGRGDGIYLNTAGIGEAQFPGLSPAAIRPGDKVLVSGPIGDHGTAVMLSRHAEGLGLSAEGLQSDCMPLCEIAAAACRAGGVRVLRDATRGGVATTLNEFTEGRAFGVRLLEENIPVRPQVAAACELLGLEPLYCACEGRMLCIVSPETAGAALAAIRAVPGGENAAEIGTVTDEKTLIGRVALQTPLGANRILTKLAGAQLPRIC